MTSTLLNSDRNESLAASDTSAPSRNGLPSGVDVEVFYDGDCPLCVREINLLRRWDKEQRILFSDIASAEFNPEILGIDYSRLMAEIHGRLPDGSIITGVEVFRRLYSAVGFRWPVTLSRLPLIKQILDLGYVLFARNRLRLTGRCGSEGCKIDPTRRD